MPTCLASGVLLYALTDRRGSPSKLGWAQPRAERRATQLPPDPAVMPSCCVLAVAVPKVWVRQCSSAETIQLSLTGLDGGVGGRRELRMGSGRQSEVLLSVSVLGH